jgi:hypothetical protein
MVWDLHKRRFRLSFYVYLGVGEIMFARILHPLPKSLPWLVACGLVWLATGCNSDPYGLGKTAVVRGRVLIADTPLHNGIVTFQPEASKGNTTPHQPTAPIGENGTYELFTVGKGAAPLGWYKVTVSAYETDNDIAKRAKSPGEEGRTAKSLIPRKYEDIKTTPLSIEVVENPTAGAYDLKLTK